MDTITQGVLGAAVSQSVMKRRLPRGAGWIGAIGAMLPDLDIFIRSATDPTVSWVFHRHFTHSLFFIPIGGLIAALPFLWMGRFRQHRKEVILASIIGYSTHAPLDMLTNYGTQLFWPFSTHRVALDWIGIVDPIYSLILLVGVALTAYTGKAPAARIAFLLSVLYIFFGGWQHSRAVEIQNRLAEMRGHQVEHSRVMPAPGWLVLWRSAYVTGGRLYVDGIRTPWFNPTLVREGGSANLTTFEQLPEKARQNPEARRQFEILIWFADGLIAPIENDSTSIGDMRITGEVTSLTPLWGLRFDPDSGQPARWIPPTTISRSYNDILRILINGGPGYKPLSELRASTSPALSSETAEEAKSPTLQANYLPVID